VNPENGIKPEKITGNIKFENVVFSYPKDKTKIILNNISIEFHLSNTALVGESGCGKSTILQLIMRFYDPDEGRILLDGIDLK
jgi:ATP-binding cassette subfamily B (MDR/TAP) protein 1